MDFPYSNNAHIDNSNIINAGGHVNINNITVSEGGASNLISEYYYYEWFAWL